MADSALVRRRPSLLTPAFLAVALASLAYFIADGITIPVLQVFVVGPLGGDAVAVGIAYGAFSLSAFLLRPWVGRISDTRGRRPLILGGAALFGLGVLGHLVATSLPILVLMRLVLGAGEAMIFVGALAAVSDLAPDARRGEAISYFSLSLYLGIAIGPFIGEVVLGDDRFALVWLVAAGMAGLSVIFGLRVPETLARAEPTPAGTPAPRSGWRGLVHPGGLLPGLVLLASTTGMGGYFAFTKLYTESLGMDSSRYAFALLAGVVIVFRTLMPWMPDRLGARRAASIALAFNTAGLLVIGLWAAPVGLYVGTGIFAFGVCFAFPALSAMTAQAVPPAERGAAFGTFSAFLDLAFGLGPAVVGVVVHLNGLGAAYVSGAVVAAAGLALLWFTRPEQPAPAAEAVSAGR
ncbi:MAG: MFS transporter [Candidatus Limnocylindria bacterium]